jgi:hypothetical protein
VLYKLRMLGVEIYVVDKKIVKSSPEYCIALRFGWVQAPFPKSQARAVDYRLPNKT